LSAETAGPRRILMAVHHYPPHVGGMEIVAWSEATRLAALGHEVTVLTSSARSSVVSEDGVRVVRVAAWNGLEDRMGVPFPLFSPRILVRAVRLARWAQLIHVHDCFYLSSWSAGLGAVLARRPLVLSQHVGLVDHPSGAVRAIQRLVYRIAGRPLVRRAGRVFVINEYVARFVAGLGAAPGKVVVLSNGADPDRFRPAADQREREELRKQYNLPLDRPLALFVGRLVPKKGIDIALAAHAANSGEFDLVAAGSGDAGALADRPGVHFLGSLTQDQVADAFRACDLFVLPTVGEVFPLVVQEAMRSGLPVVTTDEPDYAAAGVDPGGMALVPRGAAAVGAAICEIAADERTRERMSAYSLAYAQERFSWTAHVDLLRENYAAVTDRPR
jgi:glycosyltransferase involved in cell wall biosynthesis